MHTCCDVRTVCVSMIEQSTQEIKKRLALHTLNRALHSTSPTTSPITPNINVNNSLNNTVKKKEDKKEEWREDKREDEIQSIDVLIARTVVRACLAQLKSKNQNDPIFPFLLPLLRIQTIHTENIPEKGTTVWYVQHKNVQILNRTFSTDVSYSSSKLMGSNFGDFLGVKHPGVRTVSSLECLEGKLIGIHKDGNEEPFYTVSLSVPVDGNAGNTVREIQTNGYR